MELGQLTWPQATPAMQAVHILTDGGLDHALLVQFDKGHMGEGRYGFYQLHSAARLKGCLCPELPYARTSGQHCVHATPEVWNATAVQQQAVNKITKGKQWEGREERGGEGKHLPLPFPDMVATLCLCQLQ